MELEVLKLLYNYSIKEKVIDANFISRIFNSVIDNYNIKDYLNSFYIINNEDTVGAYNEKEKTIKINLHKLNKLCFIDGCTLGLYGVQNTFFINIQILICLFHELEHARQNSLLFKANTYSMLLYYGKIFSNQLIANTFFNSFDKTIDDEYLKALYDKTYDYNPCERGAYIISNETIYNIIKKERVIASIIKEDVKSNVYTTSLSGYKYKNNVIVPPSYTFLKEIGKDNYWNNLFFVGKNNKETLKNIKLVYSLEDRLKCGFPISISEYNKIERKNYLLQRKIFSRTINN